MLRKLRSVLKGTKGQGLVEYGILVGGVALVCLAAVAILGHKANDLMAVTAAALPGAHAEDNGAIVSGILVAVTDTGTGGALQLDVSAPGTFGGNIGLSGLDNLIAEP